MSFVTHDNHSAFGGSGHASALIVIEDSWGYVRDPLNLSLFLLSSSHRLLLSCSLALCLCLCLCSQFFFLSLPFCRFL
jgi:hypothetical protein